MTKGKFKKFYDLDTVEELDFPDDVEEQKNFLQENCNGESHSNLTWNEFSEIIEKGDLDDSLKNILVYKYNGVYHCFSEVDVNNFINTRKDHNGILLADEYSDIMYKFANKINNKKIMVEINGIPTDVSLMVNYIIYNNQEVPVYDEYRDSLLMSDLEITSIRNTNFPEHIEYIYLDGNKLETIEQVKFPSKLKVIYLQENKLRTIDNVIFPPSLVELRIDGNGNNVNYLPDHIMTSNLKVIHCNKKTYERTSQDVKNFLKNNNISYYLRDDKYDDYD